MSLQILLLLFGFIFATYGLWEWKKYSQGLGIKYTPLYPKSMLKGIWGGPDWSIAKKHSYIKSASRNERRALFIESTLKFLMGISFIIVSLFFMR